MLEEISLSVSGTLDVVGEIAYSLRPYQLEYLGLTKALNALIKRACARETADRFPEGGALEAAILAASS